VLLLAYIPAVCLAGLALGRWFADRERALQVLLFTALPMAFLSGFSWPVEAMPEPLQWLRWLFPSTAGIQASLRLNQMGASLADVAPLILWLLVQATLAALAAVSTGWARRPP
jgi:ABC-2 type transport system permease protein